MSNNAPTTYDFGDGAGPVPAARHHNLDGRPGGWVAATATVAPTAFVGEAAEVFGNAQVRGTAVVAGDASVFGAARVFESARVFGDARVAGDAWVSGAARVSGNASVSGNARVSGDAWVTGNAVVRDDARVFGNSAVWGDARVGGVALVSGAARVAGGEVRGNDLFSAVLPDGLAVTLTTTHLAVGCQCHPFKTWAKTWEAVAEGHDFSAEMVQNVKTAVRAGAAILKLTLEPEFAEQLEHRELAAPEVGPLEVPARG